MQAVNKTSQIQLKSKLFRGFGDASRLLIIETLRDDGPKSVSEIVAASGLTQPNVSNHLACLRECGLLSAEQNGKYVCYKIADPRVSIILEHAEALLNECDADITNCTRY
ncbi:MAG: transcriptional regulator [Candidatus Melainabacteria bacterium]|jgi:DNA-binding transcriptional ArsR family regulator|nr:helix-turn-helix transcriptional regulator [Candidatus Melainabacteria bacterium]RTL37230.1 MAG: transcriptional regulator [Candidatus Melainabacteria bacterium]